MYLNVKAFDFLAVQTPVPPFLNACIFLKHADFSYTGKKTGHHGVGINSRYKILGKVKF
jgi:hypothetical protein